MKSKRKNKPLNYWTKERCAEVALKCETKIEFKKHFSCVYVTAHRNDWIEEICGHMVGNKPIGYWTKERCAEEALKYKTRIEFQRGNSGAYRKACKNGWMDDICNHMVSGVKSVRYWTKEKCIEKALKYKTKEKFKVGDNLAYQATYRYGWVDEVCKHMISRKNKPRNK